MSTSKITMIIPNLLPRNANEQKKITKTSSTVLQKLIRKAKEKVTNYSNMESLLFDIFNISTQDDFPVAAITALAYNLPGHEGYWLFADPIQLRADLAGVYFLGNAHLNLQPSEIETLSQQLKTLLYQDGIVLHTPSSDHWFLQMEFDPKIITVPPNEIIGKEISHYLPKGDNQKRWQRLLTEIQMLLYEADVNRARELQNKPIMNGVWLWGEGKLPMYSNNKFQSVIADSPFLIGLAKLAGSEVNDLLLSQSCFNKIIQNNKDILFFCDELEKFHHQDPLFQKALSIVEANFFIPLSNALKNNNITEITLYPNHQTKLVITKKKWWQIM